MQFVALAALALTPSFHYPFFVVQPSIHQYMIIQLHGTHSHIPSSLYVHEYPSLTAYTSHASLLLISTLTHYANITPNMYTGIYTLRQESITYSCIMYMCISYLHVHVHTLFFSSCSATACAMRSSSLLTFCVMYECIIQYMY